MTDTDNRPCRETSRATSSLPSCARCGRPSSARASRAWRCSARGRGGDNRPDSDIDLMIEVDPDRKFSLVELDRRQAHRRGPRLGLRANVFMRRSLKPRFLDECRAGRRRRSFDGRPRGLIGCGISRKASRDIRRLLDGQDRLTDVRRTRDRALPSSAFSRSSAKPHGMCRTNGRQHSARRFRGGTSPTFGNVLRHAYDQRRSRVSCGRSTRTISIRWSAPSTRCSPRTHRRRSDVT